MDLSAARDELRARGFDGLTDARCNTFLNAGKNALEDAAAWPWLHATTTGTAPLTIADLKAVKHVWVVASNAAIWGADSGFLRRQFGPDLTQTGTASYWYVDDLTTLSVFPADTATTFSVAYTKFSPELSAAADTPLFPARLHPIWIDLAVVEAYVDADEPAMAQAVQAKADVRLEREIGVFLSRNAQNPGVLITNAENF